MFAQMRAAVDDAMPDCCWLSILRKLPEYLYGFIERVRLRGKRKTYILKSAAFSVFYP